MESDKLFKKIFRNDIVLDLHRKAKEEKCNNSNLD